MKTEDEIRLMLVAYESLLDRLQPQDPSHGHIKARIDELKFVLGDKDDLGG